MQKLRIKWHFELTVFELTVPDLYLIYLDQQSSFWTMTEFTETRMENK